MRILGMIAAAGVFLGSALAASADPIPVNELSRYLNSVQTLVSSFKQVNNGGPMDSGRFYMQRPYRLRFEYETQPVLVLASAGNVAIFDDKNGTPEQYPMSRTPLSLILSPKVDLASQSQVVGHGEINGNTIITLRDPSGTTPGTVELLFSPGPVLRQWTTTDDAGERTTVILENPQVGVNLKASAFSINSEMQRRGPRR